MTAHDVEAQWRAVIERPYSLLSLRDRSPRLPVCRKTYQRDCRRGL